MTVRVALAGLLLFGVGVCTGHAQGCAQCRDNTAATSPATQRAYAHAIELMTGAAATIFIAGLVVLKRHP